MMPRRDDVSLRDIYDAVNGLEAKMVKRFENVEEDVDGLKAFQNRTLGILGVFTAVFSLAINWVWDKLTRGS